MSRAPRYMDDEVRLPQLPFTKVLMDSEPTTIKLPQAPFLRGDIFDTDPINDNPFRKATRGQHIPILEPEE